MVWIGRSLPDWVCAVCGEHVDIATPFVWRCPNATDTDRHHALQLVQGIAPLRGDDDPNPFVAFRRYLAWDGFAAANGMTEAARTALVAQADADIAEVAGVGFHVTPFQRADDLSDALGFGADGGVWVKDETGQVAGSHKPRHLFTILLHLLTAESTGLAPWSDTGERPPLAIASCGNAAYAAATLAAAARWPLRVFVPTHADPVVLALLRELRADIVECPRRPADPPGDPCIHRFREAVAGGAIAVHRAGPGERVVPRWRSHDRLGDGPPVRGGRAWTAARPCLRAGRRRHVRRVGDRRHPDERSHAASCTPCRPTAARRWPASWETGSTTGRTSDCRRPLGRMHVAVGARRQLGGRRHPRRRDLRLDTGAEGNGREQWAHRSS